MKVGVEVGVTVKVGENVKDMVQVGVAVAVGVYVLVTVGVSVEVLAPPACGTSIMYISKPASPLPQLKVALMEPLPDW